MLARCWRQRLVHSGSAVTKELALHLLVPQSGRKSFRSKVVRPEMRGAMAFPLAVLLLGTTAPLVGHEAVDHGRLGASPARSNMIMVMKFVGSWKPRALVRSRPIEALFDSAMPLVRRHSMVASMESR